MLACLGWTRPRLFAVVLGEVALIGLTAGILGGAAVPARWPRRWGCTPPRPARPWPCPVADGAGAWWPAPGLPGSLPAPTRSPPSALRCWPCGAPASPAGITGLAAVNVLRTPGLLGRRRPQPGRGGLLLTLATGVTTAFRGVVVGSLLGDAVAVQVRVVDYVAVAATVALGVLAVADVVALRHPASDPPSSPRSGRFFPESALGRLVISEALLIGVAGSVTGAAAGPRGHRGGSPDRSRCGSSGGRPRQHPGRSPLVTTCASPCGATAAPTAYRAASCRGVKPCPP